MVGQKEVDAYIHRERERVRHKKRETSKLKEVI